MWSVDNWAIILDMRLSSMTLFMDYMALAFQLLLSVALEMRVLLINVILLMNVQLKKMLLVLFAKVMQCTSLKLTPVKLIHVHGVRMSGGIKKCFGQGGVCKNSFREGEAGGLST